MELVWHYEYRVGCTEPLDALHEMTKCGADGILCRIRRSADNVLFVCRETVMTELCACDEYVSKLSFREIDALMRLCGYRVLTLDALLDGYHGEMQVILHFRTVRPDGSLLGRIMQNPHFTVATDSVEQLRVIAEGFPANAPIGFACHLPTAMEMAEAGASAVCLYGRELTGFSKDGLAALAEKIPVWYELICAPEDGVDAPAALAEKSGVSRLVLPLAYM